MPLALSKMKVAVIGGNGYLGHHVSEYFKADALSKRNGFDITDNSVMKRLQEYDVIIHMAALVDKTERQPQEVFRVNSDGTRNVVSSLTRGQTLIFVSTKEVYTPLDTYSYSKIIAEKYVEYYAQALGFKAGIFRLSTTYAPPTNGSTFVNYFVDSIKKGRELKLMMRGEQIRDFLYVGDLCRAFEMFNNSGLERGLWDIGGGNGNSTTMLDLTNTIGKIVGKNPVISFSAEPVKGQVHYITDLSKINEALGWNPQVSIEEGIKRIV